MSIKLSDVNYTYMKDTPFEKTGIKNINLEISEGEFVAIIGHTGSGKSTLVQHLKGLLTPDSGTVIIDDVNINQNTVSAKAAKNKVGIVFQYPEQQLFEETVYKDVTFGPKNMGMPEEKLENIAKQSLEFVSLDYEKYKNRSPFQLSGGQMRKVAIAGVIALKPKYLILDEPAAGLDPVGRDDLFEKISKLYQETGMTVILISHNMDDVARLAQRLIVMNNGEISIDDKPEQVFKYKEKLVAAGLALPQITELLSKLKQQGLAVEENIIKLDDAIVNIKTAWGVKNNAK
ncbi:MAG: energy-coupling factor transporter ATPase [Negativicutes bacterium]|jgi:energy-coupling factor transport system ATP-binding protein|nr:energy-coupling factor transporter ATPase [Negativicutes bacterium]MBP8628537.1 energy-coupling factor transporter ATPase [Negativicutes bacterium]MBP9536669.1 energy-coupling factor transporter ATPase [Negativicutes bacterium]MBP9948917.1 energy-coupling factor transporter ATPase [Negativicutes bacterium]